MIFTTDPELDKIITELDSGLNRSNVSDNKRYINSSHFFINITLARFGKVPPSEFINKVSMLSKKIKVPNYTVDKVSLITCNAVLSKLKIIDSWVLG